MILDYCYNKYKKQLEISYINKNGNKKLYTKNIIRFIGYKRDPNGVFINWDGDKCSEYYITTDSPSKFVLKQTISSENLEILNLPVNPRIYTFDIETGTSRDEFPDPNTAKFPIYTISIVNPDLHVLVLGTKYMNEENEDINNKLSKYLEQSSFYNETVKNTLSQKPSIRYKYFSSEKEMLSFFLSNIVAKVPILSGWNTYGFDWPYIVNRIKNNYPDISLYSMSITSQIENKALINVFKNEKTEIKTYPIPIHTLLLDHINLVNTYDTSGLVEKESLALDYISNETVGIGKVKYTGNLEELYNSDFETYVFYNSIDSVLVQLIEKRLKILPILSTQAVYCKERLSKAFGKIAYCEALVYNWFLDHGYKIVDDFKKGEKVQFQGAYVRDPTPGLHHWLCCNDFSSLYPSVIVSAGKDEKGGISFENYVGSNHSQKYYISDDEIENYKKDSNYFVTIDRCVFKNDKEYCLKSLQKTLKSERAINKYLSKELDSTVMSDIENFISILKGKAQNSRMNIQEYHENVQNALLNLFPNEEKEVFKNTVSLIRWIKTQGSDFLTTSLKISKIIKDDIIYRDSVQTAIKLLMNSIYGGSSHELFSWYNIDVAQAITAEGRAVIHKMEEHLPQLFNDEFPEMIDLHTQLGIQLDFEKISSLKKEGKNLVDIIYGDTDSLYLSYENLISCIQNLSTDSQILQFIISFNTNFLNEYNKKFLAKWYQERNGTSIHEFELETIAKSGIWTDGKKKYVQALVWKDGKIFSEPKWKSKGFETGKPSWPRGARKILKKLITFMLLEMNKNDYPLQRLNIRVQEEKNEFMKLPLEEICENISINVYYKYIIDDKNKLELKLGCPYNVRAAATYNYFINKYKFKDKTIHSGKMRLYNYIDHYTGLNQSEAFIAFEAGNKPDWLEKRCPPARDFMFEKYIINPLNRLTQACKIGILRSDGSIELSLF